MGSIASVLQWHCERCTLINPTERTKCVRCGTRRDSLQSGRPSARVRKHSAARTDELSDKKSRSAGAAAAVYQVRK
ncbi:Uncharacterized protein GBIM_17720 [Gryllus bimaculatus]|nr:Uncharacterized protein GBIM_17720 [Gryllus bimaculatus]